MRARPDVHFTPRSLVHTVPRTRRIERRRGEGGRLQGAALDARRASDACVSNVYTYMHARVHDQRTWEGHASSKFHAHLSSASRLSFDEGYDLPDSLIEHAVSAARAALIAGRNSRGLTCTCGKEVDDREKHATTDAEADAFFSSMRLPWLGGQPWRRAHPCASCR